VFEDRRARFAPLLAMYPKPPRPSTWLSLWLCASVGAAWFFPALRSSAASQRNLHTLLIAPEAHGSIRVHRFRLPVAGLHVGVVDLGYKTPLGDVLGDADLVINGGYWGWIDERRRTLIGLLVNGGKQLSPLREVLKGGVLTLHEGRASIRGSHGYTLPQNADLALQCRPRLVVDRGVWKGLNSTTHAARTAACVRDGGTTLDMYVTDPEGQGTTLEALARWLLSEGCDHALNLDGGPSTAAAFHERGQVVRLGSGERLPYALRFHY
jgi:hypothetical protein